MQQAEKQGSLCRSCGQRKRPFESLYNRFVAGAHNSGRAVELSYEEFLEFTAVEECIYCGNRVVWTRYNSSNKGSCASNLDRKDNNLGYSKHNCVVCCARCNRAKGSDFTFEEFLGMMNWLREFRQSKVNV